MDALGERKFRDIVGILPQPGHIHTYIHIYIRTYIHTYIYTYARTYIHTYIHTYVHTYIHIYMPYGVKIPLLMIFTPYGMLLTRSDHDTAKQVPLANMHYYSIIIIIHTHRCQLWGEGDRDSLSLNAKCVKNMWSRLLNDTR